MPPSNLPVRKAVDHLATRGAEDLAGLTLMSDGVSLYECRSAEDAELLQARLTEIVEAETRDRRELM